MPVDRSSDARTLARQILARGIVGADAPEAIGEGLQRACARVIANLCQSVGDDGCQGLMARGLTLTEGEYPVLADLFRRGHACPDPDEMRSAVARHGVASVTTALEVLLAVLVDILSGLVGEDMVRNLLDPESPSSGARRARQAP
jgi:hypothetical protein